MNPPIQVTASVAQACDVIRAGIQKGVYPGGSWIREVAVAELAKVSRTSVRQALNVLAVEGFVELHPNRGALVVDWTDENLIEVFDLRVMLEAYGCELAAARATPEDVQALQREADVFSELVERKPGARNSHLIAESNNRLHQLILASAKNPRLATLMVAVVQVPMVRQTFARYAPHDLARSAMQHQDLVAAIARKDREWARATMRSHILAARQVIFGAAAQPGHAPEASPGPAPAPSSRSKAKPPK